MPEKSLAVFEGKQIRRHYDENLETWYFSVVDVVGALTNSVNPRDYWFKMKIRVKSEDGIELSTICRQLKMQAPDGKMRTTDAASARLGRGFSKRSLKQYRRFYECYREIAQAVPAQSLKSSLDWQEIRQALPDQFSGSISDVAITLRKLSSDRARQQSNGHLLGLEVL